MQQALLSAGLAAVGAVVGASIALSRFKVERTYDKRLAWHLSALRTIHDLESEIAEWSYIHSDWTPELRRTIVQFERIVSEAEAFSPEIASRLETVAKRYFKSRVVTRLAIGRLAPDTDAPLDSSPTKNEIDIALAEERNSVKSAEELIVSELRRLMPVETFVSLPSFLRRHSIAILVFSILALSVYGAERKRELYHGAAVLLCEAFDEAEGQREDEGQLPLFGQQVAEVCYDLDWVVYSSGSRRLLRR